MTREDHLQAAPPVSAGWDQLIEQVNPAALLITIEFWLGTDLARWCSAEDVWQETLLAAWQNRERFEWRGVAAFRKWLLQIARHRLQDLADEHEAVKRGGGQLRRMADLGTRSSNGNHGTHHLDARPFGPLHVGAPHLGRRHRISPDGLAVDRERARLLRSALAALPTEFEPVVRMRLFEDLPIGEIADRLGLGIPAVRYRLRKGLGRYRQHLRTIGGAPTGETRAPTAEG